MLFRDRRDAGRKLAQMLGPWRETDVVVLGLPRGGVPVAYEVARALDAPLDVLLVRKLGVPSQRELAMGAIGEDGVRVLNERVLASAGVSETQLAAVEGRERAELERRAARFAAARAPLRLDDRVAIVVDDGLATGASARAACRVARAAGARQTVLAIPVAPRETVSAIEAEDDDVDEVVCVAQPEGFFAIGQWYDDFTQTTDDEVIALLQQGRGSGG